MRQVLLCLLLLAGCGSFEAHDFRTEGLGTSKDFILGCAGEPDKTIKLSDGGEVLEYDYKPSIGTNSGAIFSLQVTQDFELRVGQSGGCRTLVTMRYDRVQRINYSQTQTDLTGPVSVCGGVVEACLYELHKHHIPLISAPPPAAIKEQR